MRVIDEGVDPPGRRVLVSVLASDWEAIEACARRDSRTPQRIVHVAVVQYVKRRKVVFDLGQLVLF